MFMKSIKSLKKISLFLFVIACMASAPLRAEDPFGCDNALEKCADAVEAQKKTIDKQDELIKEQDKQLEAAKHKQDKVAFPLFIIILIIAL